MTEEKKGNKRKVILLFIAVILISGFLTAGFFFIVRKPVKPVEMPEVGSIDKEKIFELPEFKAANEKLEKIVNDSAKKFEEETKGMNENVPADQKKIMELRAKYEKELMAQRNAIIVPLYKKAEAATAQVALKRGLNTILDKKIVVCGSLDITDEVVEIMKANKTVEMPPEKELDALTAKAKIGYFDQAVVVNLKDFREAQLELEKIIKRYKEEFDKAVKEKKLTQEQQAQLDYEMSDAIRSERDKLYAPVFRKVNREVEKVAKEKNLSLVVDKENVMWGGMNVTDDVADSMK